MEQQRAILAVAISLAILLIYNEFILPTLHPQGDEVSRVEGPADLPPLAADEGERLPPPPVADVPEAGAMADVPAAPAQRVTVDTDFYTAVLTSAGGRIESFRLKNHRTSVDPDSPWLEIVEPGQNGELPFGVDLRGLDRETNKVRDLNDRIGSYAISAEGTLHVGPGETRTVEMIWPGPAGTIKKRLTFHGDRRSIDTEVVAESIDAQYTQLAVAWSSPIQSAEHENLFDHIEYLAGRSLEMYQVDDDGLKSGIVVEPSRTAEDPGWDWVGLSGRHFMVAMIPETASPEGAEAPGMSEPRPTLFLKQRAGDALADGTAQKYLRAQLLFPIRGAGVSEGIKLYLGAKSVELLEPVGHKLSRAVDLGWFSFVALPLLWMLRQCHRLTGNYGVDIVLLTVLIKILFLPLTQKSFTAMKGMQKIQPEVERLREQLKDKPDEMQKQLMELYRKHGVNPLGGCLPMVIQIPVFIGLYQALLNAVELRHAPFVGWIVDLSAPDRLGSFAIPFVHPPGIPVLTVVMGASMLLQQWMTPSTGDPTQRRMMMILPLAFTFMFINFPAGLVLYWTVNNVLTIAQQYYVHRTTA